MFKYQHPVRRFGQRTQDVTPPRAARLSPDMRFFLSAYAAGAAFTFAYLA